MAQQHYLKEFTAELSRIADWWLEHTIDEQYGGFIGEVDNRNKQNTHANKSLVLNTRILWFFSEAAHTTGDAKYGDAADRAYQYLQQHFSDPDHGGYRWELNFDGSPNSNRKQVYGQAFVIYALCAYYQLSKNKEALKHALTTFELIEQYAFDEQNGGYLEAFDQQWEAISDLRLSDKDLNYPKTMNTHLHVLEAYTALHRLCPTQKTSDAVERLLGYFAQFIINPETQHLRMFLDETWQDRSNSYSYGHDIEASWLLWEALEVLDQTPLLEKYKPIVLGLADSCLNEGLNHDGVMIDGYDFINKKPKLEYPWWGQAEALVGFYNAYQISGEDRYLTIIETTWQFIKQNLIDTDYGEWFWEPLNPPYSEKPSSTECQSRHPTYYKAGSWKGPYHNGRAMMEMIKRITKTPN